MMTIFRYDEEMNDRRCALFSQGFAFSLDCNGFLILSCEQVSIKSLLSNMEITIK